MKKIIIFTFILLLLSIFTNPVWAKYVIEENIVVLNIQIDRTSPNVEINYSNKELTYENVEVTIKSNEELQKIEGWIMQEDKKTLKKEYNKNTKEEIKIKDLSGNITNAVIEIDNIDNKAPIIKIIDISNSNTEYPNYANKDAEININISIEDDKKIIGNLQENDIKILIDDNEITPKIKTITIKKNEQKEKQILLKISGIYEEGKLSLKIPKDIIKDEIGNSNIEVIEDLKIQIDNTKPELTFLQKELEDGKIEAQILANEKIRILQGWEKENDKSIKNVFVSNVLYETEIQDLAGNKESIEIDIKKASNVVLSYASHNSEVGWTYGHGNEDIAGLSAIQINAKFKTESIAFSIDGTIEQDFLETRVYVHTNWEQGSGGICHENKEIYYHGWNPLNDEWATLLNKENIILNGKNYIQFGGSGINHANNTDINGNNPISKKDANEYKFGVSAIQLKLKDNSEYSVVYQIYINEIGWIEPAKNGEIACYKNDKPMSAIRISLIPNSELNSLLSTWNKDIRKIYKLTFKNY